MCIQKQNINPYFISRSLHSLREVGEEKKSIEITHMYLIPRTYKPPWLDKIAYRQIFRHVQCLQSSTLCVHIAPLT